MQIGDFVQSVHYIMKRDAAVIHYTGEPYWRQWSSAITPETSTQIDRFFNIERITPSVINNLKEYTNCHEKLLDDYDKIKKKMSKGKLYNSYTGKLLADDLANRYIHLITTAISCCNELS